MLCLLFLIHADAKFTLCSFVLRPPKRKSYLITVKAFAEKTIFSKIYLKNKKITNYNYNLNFHHSTQK